jgi:hypothetical protein
MDDWSVYPAFASLYRATTDRVAAAQFYYFSDRYFEELGLMLRTACTYAPSWHRTVKSQQGGSSPKRTVSFEPNTERRGML